jgi:glycosyltransferase involved in cell wall biosynthesis
MNLLVLTPLVPYPPHDGDKLRLYHLLAGLKRRGHRIDLFCLTRVKEDIPRASELHPLCRRVHAEHLTDFDLFFNVLGAMLTGRSFNVFSYFSPRFRDALRAYRDSEEGDRVDAILAHRLRMAPYAFEHAPKAPVVLELTDSMTLVNEQLRATPSIRLSRRLAALWDRGVIAEEEAAWAGRSERSVLVSPVDGDALRQRGVPVEKLAVIPNGVAVPRGSFPRPRAYPKGAPVVAFVGNMGYAPNEEGALWFLRNVWPLVRERVPKAVFAAAGGHPRDVLKARGNGSDVLVTGYLPAIEPYVKHAAVTVAPLNVSAGMQNKVALSLALGVPVVATPGTVAWLPGPARDLVIQAADAREFASRVTEVLARPAKARARVRKASAFVRRAYRWERSCAELDKVLRQAIKAYGRTRRGEGRQEDVTASARSSSRAIPSRFALARDADTCAVRHGISCLPDLE